MLYVIHLTITLSCSMGKGRGRGSRTTVRLNNSRRFNEAGGNGAGFFILFSLPAAKYHGKAPDRQWFKDGNFPPMQKIPPAC